MCVCVCVCVCVSHYVLAFMDLYSIFNLQLFLFILFYHFFKSGIETPDRNGQWYQYLLTLFAIFYESNTEGSNFQIMFIYVLRLYNVCKVWTSEKPWGDPVRLTGL